MKKFSGFIDIVDAESNVENKLTVAETDATQENVTATVARIADIGSVFQNLTDGDTINAGLTITDSEDETKKASFSLENVTYAEMKEFTDMVNAAFNQQSSENNAEEVQQNQE